MIRALLEIAPPLTLSPRAHVRHLAGLALAVVDADVARWYVDDATLCDAEPMTPRLYSHTRELRDRRERVVQLLEAAGGRDPHPTFTRPLTVEQRDYKRRAQQRGACR
jgi:hypothetical protein